MHILDYKIPYNNLIGNKKVDYIIKNFEETNTIINKFLKYNALVSKTDNNYFVMLNSILSQSLGDDLIKKSEFYDNKLIYYNYLKSSKYIKSLGTYIDKETRQFIIDNNTIYTYLSTYTFKLRKLRHNLILYRYDSNYKDKLLYTNNLFVVNEYIEQLLLKSINKLKLFIKNYYEIKSKSIENVSIIIFSIFICFMLLSFIVSIRLLNKFSYIFINQGYKSLNIIPNNILCYIIDKIIEDQNK